MKPGQGIAGGTLTADAMPRIASRAGPATASEAFLTAVPTRDDDGRG